MNLYLDAFSALTSAGLVSSAGTQPWRPDQNGLHDVTRDQIWPKPYPGFGKLQIADRTAFAAAGLLFSSYECIDPAATGITIGIPAGSISTDLRYMESVRSGFPSPALFSSTLPSSVIADIAIMASLKGPNRVIAGPDDAGIAAFELACLCLHKRSASAMLVLSVAALDPHDATHALIPAHLRMANHAFAFLLTTHRAPKGLGFLLDARFCIPDKTLPANDGVSYFENLARLCAEKKGGTVPFETRGYSGYFTIEKDNT